MTRIIVWRRKDGRFIFRHPDTSYYHLIATDREPTVWNPKTEKESKVYHNSLTLGVDKESQIDFLVNSGELEQYDLVSIKWIHHHLIKPMKQQLEKYLEQDSKIKLYGKRE